MKKTILLTLISLLVVAVCFSQKNNTNDAYIGVNVELSSNNQYLKIIYCWDGSPANIAGLRNGDRIYQIDGKKINELTEPMTQIKGPSGTFVKLTIKRFNNTAFFDVNIPRISIPFDNKNYVSEGLLAALIFTDGFSTSSRFYPLTSALLYDSSRDMFNYKTYDFEYTNMKDPLMEKELFKKLGSYLDAKGMKRSEENPDLIILMNFYTGQKEQYIPPQQIISTRVKTVYNWYWGLSPMPITSSSTKGGYTDVTYLTTLNLKFLDAKEIEGNKIPPVVWSGSFSNTSKSKTLLLDQSVSYFAYMTWNFPEVWTQNSERYFYKHYAYTGLWFNRNNLKLIVEVIPESPAYKMGLRKGDEIIKINGYKLFPNYNKSGINKFYEMALAKKNSGFKYLFMFTNIAFKPYEPGVSTLEFIIKREGKKMTFEVTPEDKFIFMPL